MCYHDTGDGDTAIATVVDNNDVDGEVCYGDDGSYDGEDDDYDDNTAYEDAVDADDDADDGDTAYDDGVYGDTEGATCYCNDGNAYACCWSY